MTKHTLRSVYVFCTGKDGEDVSPYYGKLMSFDEGFKLYCDSLSNEKVKNANLILLTSTGSFGNQDYVNEYYCAMSNNDSAREEWHSFRDLDFDPRGLVVQ